MSPVTSLGGDGVPRPLIRDPQPAYRAVTVHLPEALVDSLDEHIVNRVHEGQLPDGARLELERDGVIALAIRSLIDHWPDLGPYAPRPTTQRGTGEDAAGRRSGTATSGGGR